MSANTESNLPEEQGPAPPQISAWRVLLRIAVFMLAVPALLVLLAKLLM